jgi:hypothetical protein
MKTKDMFPSKYIQAKIDLLRDGSPIKVRATIAGLREEDFEDATKYVMWFDETEKELILNKTNKNVLMDLYPADDTDAWIGKQIYLYAAEVEYKGQPTWGTRISLQVPGEKNEEEFPLDEPDDEIPF